MLITAGVEIDSASLAPDVQTEGFDDAAAPFAPARPYPFPPVVIDSDAIRVAVVDVSFDKLAALPSVAEGPMRVGLPGDDGDFDQQSARRAIAPGHGTAMAGVVLAECPGRASACSRSEAGRASVPGAG